VSVLDCSDPAALERALDALPLGTWVLVVAAGERHLLQRVPGGLHLRGDLTVHLTAELDDLDSVGWVEAGRLRDEVQAWLDLFGEDPAKEWKAW
jgi:hypothetical protein